MSSSSRTWSSSSSSWWWTAGYPPQYLAFTTASPPYHIRSNNQLHLPQKPQPELLHLPPKHQPTNQLHLPSSKLQSSNHHLHLMPSNHSASQLHLSSSTSSQHHPCLGGKPSSSQPYHGNNAQKNFHLMQSQTLPRLGGQTFPRRCAEIYFVS